MATISSDPRFQLARALLSGQVSNNESSGGGITKEDGIDEGGGGPEAAIDIFATLLEKSRQQDETSLNAALCQYEYGNALFRAVVRKNDSLDDSDDGERKQEKDGDKKPASKEDSQREIMAAAALKRSAASVVTASSSSKRAKIGDDSATNETGLKQGDGILSPDNASGKLSSANEDDVVKIENTADSGENSQEDDVNLALEMMETSFDIFLSHVPNEGSSPNNEHNHHHQQQQWALGQLPRVLVCIGDLHSYCGRFGNAVDAYCRALPYREEAWKRLKQIQAKNSDKIELLTVEDLQCQRRLVETYALVTEALLACPKGEDVICYYDDDDTEKCNDSAKSAKGPSEPEKSGETNGTVLVPAKERINFAKSHYEMAREGLDELIYRMGRMAAAKINIGKEKEDIGYLVMMVVGVGNSMKDEQN